MHNLVKEMLQKFELGKQQKHARLQVYPLLFSGNHTPEYLTLKEALEKDMLVVTEVDKGGSVPELLVRNKGDTLVLLLDGEELMGAKQNRVLNTTILLKRKSETIIPVSCTEQGRWSYSSAYFMDSDVVASPRLRSFKVSSVSESLKARRQYSSDQGQVWDQLRFMSEEADVSSPTDAMKDVYEDRGKDLNEYLDKFPMVEGQRGLLVLIDGKVVGMDYISYEPAFKLLQPKLLKSYALDALLSKKTKDSRATKKMGRDFLKKSVGCKEKKYESVGHGWDHRYESKEMVGSALIYKDTVIHLAFFSINESQKAGNMSSSSRRRGFRIL
jgi:hypothetical protein